MRALDCRLSCIQGFEAHKEWCDAILARLNSQDHCAIVVETHEPNLYYCQYNFRYENSDEYALKMLQPVGYLQMAWRHLANSHNLRTIYMQSEAVSGRLRPKFNLASAHHMTFVELNEVAPPTVPRISATHTTTSNSKGLISWLRRFVENTPQDWLTTLERRLERYSQDDLVEPSLLPEPRSTLRQKLVSEMFRHMKEEQAEGGEMRRLIAAYRALAKFHPLTRTAKLLEARTLSGTSISTFFAWADLCEGINETNGMFRALFLPMLKGASLDPQIATQFIDLDEQTSEWRPFSADPNYWVRHMLWRLGYLEEIGKYEPNVVTVAHLEWRLEAGLYRLRHNKRDEAKVDFEAIIEHAARLYADETAALRIKARDCLCEIASQDERYEDLIELARLQRADIDKTASDLDLLHKTIYKLRCHYWEIDAAINTGKSNIQCLFDEAYAYARTLDVLRTSRVVCRIADIMVLEFMMHCGNSESRMADECLQRGILALNAPTEVAIDGKPMISCFEPFLLRLSLSRMLFNLRLKENDIDGAVNALINVVPAILTLRDDEHYRSAIAMSEIMPDLPEAKIQEVIDDIAGFFKELRSNDEIA